MKLVPNTFTQLAFKLDDGGRAAAGFPGTTGDCVVRAIAIALECPYAYVYERVNQWCDAGTHKWQRGYAHRGVCMSVYHALLKSSGWRFINLQKKGMKKSWFCQEHLPRGRVIAAIEPDEHHEHHLSAVIDHVVHDHGNTVVLGPKVLKGYYVKRSKRRKKRKS